jgi:hypothetical protein
MDHEVRAVESLDRLIWAVIVLVAAFVVTALLLSNFHLAWQTFAAPALACSTLLAGGWFYSRWRADARLASGLFSTAQLIAFAPKAPSALAFWSGRSARLWPPYMGSDARGGATNPVKRLDPPLTPR